ncbi:hypothetical protein HQ531_05040 [bacterium]|nr:hypothetical protein [bacterium]
MELAIEVMNKSINESRPDGKVPPKVGAVVLFQDGTFETAYRGELREGDHAEYTLFERKLVSKDLSECVLFTTLEPCVQRNSPKVSCCKRTTNARIEKVFVGIEDPDPTVDGKGLKHLHKHDVEVAMFDRDLQKIIEEENKTFIEQALERKYKADKKDEDLRSPLEMQVPHYDKSRFSEEALIKFITEGKLIYKISDASFWQFLSDFGAMEWDETSKLFIATGFGILLFGENPRANYPQAVLKASVTYDGSKVETKDFSDPLVLVPDRVEEWLHKVLPLAKNTSKFKRKDVPIYPIDVLREAIVNAIVHRDYEIEGASCSVTIDNNMIKVNSPGNPVPEISIDELNSFSAPSIRRNPIITYVFSLMDYVEEKGFGMSTFKSIREKHGYPLPKYLFMDPFLSLSFPRTQDAASNLVGSKSIDQLSKDEITALEVFRTNKSLSKSEFVDLTGLATRTAERLLKKFVDLDLIRREGAGRSIKYAINE